MMRHILLVVTSLTLLFSQPIARASSLLTNVRAADVLSDLLTYAADRTDANINAMQNYLEQTGQAAAYQKNPPAAPGSPRLTFQQVFKAAILFVQDGGDKYADPMLASRRQDDLLDTLTQLQSYNVQQFLHLEQRRESCDSLRAFIQSANHWDKYQQWAAQNAPDVATHAGLTPATQPASPEELAERIKALTEYAREMAWRKAQAQGVSAADFDAQWRRRLAEHKDRVALKVEGVRQLGSSLTRSAPTGTQAEREAQRQAEAAAAPAPLLGPIPATGTWAAAPPVQQPDRDLPPPVKSPHTREEYRRRNNEVYWNPWDGRFYNRGVPLD